MTKTVSIVTVTYKDPTGLRATIDSLRPLLASGQAWEHVVVDSSPEENAAILKDLPANWPLVHVEAPARGVYAAFNVGLERVSGEFVWFLNGGDRLKDAAVLKRVAALDSTSDLMCAAVELTRDGKYLYALSPAANLLAGIVGNNRICHQAIVYRRSVFERIGPYPTDLKIAGDYEHHFRCYAEGMKMGRLDEVLAVYDMSGVSGDNPRAFSEFWRVHARMGDKLPAWVRVANGAVWTEERVKIAVIKFLARSQAAVVLRPLWIAWNRIRHR